MIVRRATIALAGVWLGLAAPTHADELPPADVAIERLVKRAKPAQKPIVLEFYRLDCESCTKFGGEITADPAVVKPLSRVVFMRFDIASEPGRAIATRYGIADAPALVVLDPAGGIQRRYEGAVDSVDWFLSFLRWAHSVTDAAATVGTRRGDRTAPRDDLQAARWYRARGQYREAMEHYEVAVSKTGDNSRAAEAAFELSKLSAAIARRKRVVADAVAFVDKFPESRKATEELLVAVLSGDLSVPRTRQLLASHVVAVPANSRHIITAAYVALAIGAADEALIAANRAISHQPLVFEAHIALAEAYLHKGDLVSAQASRQIACRDAVGERSAECRRLAARIAADIRNGSEHVERVKQRARTFFEVVENPAQAALPLDRGDRGKRLSSFRERAGELFEKAGDKCARHRGVLGEAWVRLSLADDGGPPRSIAVLEPGASRELADCLRSALDGDLPPAPSFYGGRYAWAVRFSAESKDPRRTPIPDPVLGGRLHHAYLYLSGMAGVADTLGAGTRAVLDVGRIGPVDGVASWDLNGGVTSDGKAAYSLRAMTGVAFLPPTEQVRVSVLTGLGVSRIGEQLPNGFDIPLELVLTVSHPRLRGLVWARTNWLLGDEQRQRDGGLPILGTDEFAIGAGVRVPASSPHGFFIAAAYTQYAAAQTMSVMLGTSVDSF